MADSKLADLTEITSPANTDILYVVANPATTPVDRKITVANLRGASGSTTLLHVRDEKTSGTNGGTFTSGAWQTRDLNTVKTNEISGASLASNAISLPAGTYEIDATVPAFGVNRHQARLYDVTGAAALLVGTTEVCTALGYETTRSMVAGRFTLSVTSSVRLEHRCETTASTTGFGTATGWGTEVYTDVMIRKVA